MMKTVSRAREVLEAVSWYLPKPATTDSDRIETTRVLWDLANVYPGRLGEVDRKNLEILCREMAVSKRPLRFYEANWSKPADRESLPTAWWPLLIAVFFAHCGNGEYRNENERGLAFKSLNAGLSALEMAAQTSGMPHLSMLRSWSEEIFENLCCEGKA